MINISIVLVSGFFGLLFGSFLNVVALRTLSKESLVFPPSHCTSCNHKLGFFDLFPVFSYILLGGKCRYCKDKIPALYPFGEILTAVSFAVVAYHYGWTPVALIHFVFLAFMVIATITDIKETMVPDKVILMGFLLVFTLRALLGESILSYSISAILSFLLLFTIFILSGGKMGGADVKIYALIGLSIGFNGAVSSLFYASFLSILYHLPLLLRGKWDREREIPFVPFITVAIIITYCIKLYNLLPY